MHSILVLNILYFICDNALSIYFGFHHRPGSCIRPGTDTAFAILKQPENGPGRTHYKTKMNAYYNKRVFIETKILRDSIPTLGVFQKPYSRPARIAFCVLSALSWLLSKSILHPLVRMSMHACVNADFFDRLHL